MENSNFGKLSAELRNEIYRLTIEERSPKRDIERAYPDPIAQVCKQMRSECLAMCFNGATLNVDMEIETSEECLLEFENERGEPVYEPVDTEEKEEFGPEWIARTTEWLQLLDQACYDAIAALNIFVELMLTEVTGFEDHWSEEEENWRDLAGALRDRGFEAERILIQVEVWGAEHWRKSALFKEIRLAFKRIGLDVNVKWVGRSA